MVILLQHSNMHENARSSKPLVNNYRIIACLRRTPKVAAKTAMSATTRTATNDVNWKTPGKAVMRRLAGARRCGGDGEWGGCGLVG